jgi:hypothetical protein
MPGCYHALARLRGLSQDSNITKSSTRGRRGVATLSAPDTCVAVPHTVMQPLPSVPLPYRGADRSRACPPRFRLRRHRCGESRNARKPAASHPIADAPSKVLFFISYLRKSQAWYSQGRARDMIFGLLLVECMGSKRTVPHRSLHRAGDSQHA